MNKAETRFRLYAVLSVFVLLVVLLGVINGINFTMAATDADEITQRIASGKGEFGKHSEQLYFSQQNANGQPTAPMGPMGPMGPDSPEINNSVRYFTVSFTENGNAVIVSHRISAVDEEGSIEWASSLLGGSTGWTRGTYRYRVYAQGDKTFVTVIDQGRELLSAYRILIFSICGTVIGVLLSYAVLRLVGRKLFAPLAEADRKQKKFISNAEKEFKLPLTVINADTELLEKEIGPSEHTRSIHRQVSKMDSLVRSLASLSIFDEQDMARTSFSLSDLLNEALDRYSDRFTERNLTVLRDIADDVLIVGEPEAMGQAIHELMENALKYSRGNVEVRLTHERERIRLTISNPTELPNGSVDQVFDRFSVLSNAPAGNTGLGLSYVKDVALAHNGRVSARVADGAFTLQLDL